MANMTQCQQVLAYMSECGAISAKEALREFGIKHLSARIADLKKAGYKIKDTTVSYADEGVIVRYKIYEMED